jgi:type I restriction enzyme S subunit
MASIVHPTPAVGSRFQFVQWADLPSWNVHLALETRLHYNPVYPLRSIGSFLRQVKAEVIIQDQINYQRITVRGNNRGVVPRDTEVGRNIGTKRQFRVMPGQFLVSRIDARNGAMGLVPPELDGAVVTADFLPFEIDTDQIDPRFLVLITSTREFVSLCQNYSSGTTNRQRLDGQAFLDAKIPLPTLHEQHSLVVAYHAKIEQARQHRKEAEEVDAIIKRSIISTLGIEINEAFKHKPGFRLVDSKNLARWNAKGMVSLNANVPIKCLADVVIKISTGTTPPTAHKEYFGGDINFYTPADLTDTVYLNKAERTITKKAVDNGKVRLFLKNTLLFVGIGSTVGKVAIVEDNVATANQQITGLVFDESLVYVEYAYLFLHYFQNITTREQAKATLPIINQGRILDIPIPLPPLGVQRDLVEEALALRRMKQRLFESADKLESEAIHIFESSIFESNANQSKV